MANPMTPEEFGRPLALVAYERSVAGCVELLSEGPPGRSPSKASVALSEWYRGLVASDQENVRGVIRMSVHFGVFSVLAALDGVESMREAGESVGDFELRYTVDGETRVLTGPGNEMLHDLFNAEVSPE